MNNPSSNMIRFWFGFDQTVTRKGYILSGFSLMTLKYLGELLAWWILSGTLLGPLKFLWPAASYRYDGLEAENGTYYGLFLVCWSLPFLWIAISMSVRRAIDARISPWFGMIVVVPIINLFGMALLSLLPSRPSVESDIEHRHQSSKHTVTSILCGVGFGVAVGLIACTFAYFGYEGYSYVLFLSIPTIIGSASSYSYYLGGGQSKKQATLFSLASIFVCGLVIMLFALEGFICLLMALPFGIFGALIGAFLGRLIFESTSSRPLYSHLISAAIFLTLATWGERVVTYSSERVVHSSLVVNRTIDAVWHDVISFPDIDPPSELIFKTGIAYPIRAHIDGEGVGATRYCEFSTGSFVEPITIWNKPTHLAFDVIERPASLIETSFYGEVLPAHVNVIPQSKRGEFRLTALGPSTTLLEGRTWYQLNAAPESYWGLWADWIIGKIHMRVLGHIGSLNEKSPG